MTAYVRKPTDFIAISTLFVFIPIASAQSPGQTAQPPAGQSSTQTPQSTASNPASANAGKTPAQLAGVYVYPQKGQNATLQAKDEGECFDSAKQNTGFDPAAPPAAPQEAAKAPKGGTVKGSAKGAAGGAAIDRK